jgi:hypothetical protein
LIRALRKAGSKDSKPGDVLKHVSTHSFLRKPADRLGKVVLANEVSIGGLGGGRCRVGHGARNWVVRRSSKWNFLGGHVPLGKVVTVGFDSP